MTPSVSNQIASRSAIQPNAHADGSQLPRKGYQRACGVGPPASISSGGARVPSTSATTPGQRADPPERPEPRPVTIQPGQHTAWRVSAWIRHPGLQRQAARTCDGTCPHLDDRSSDRNKHHRATLGPSQSTSHAAQPPMRRPPAPVNRRPPPPLQAVQVITVSKSSVEATRRVRTSRSSPARSRMSAARSDTLSHADARPISVHTRSAHRDLRPLRSPLWGSRSRPATLTCMISALGRQGMIRSYVAAPAVFDLPAAVEPAVAAQSLVGVQGRWTPGAAS